MSKSSATTDAFDLVERAILQIGWLGQRQFMQLLADERFDLTVPQFYTLLHLSHWSGECKMSDLARATHQSAASLTGVVDRLLDKQLVERIRPEGDRRQVMVTVTPRGRIILDEIKHARNEEMRLALEEVPAEEVDLLLRLLDKVFAGMMRQSEASNAR
jgi:DNA-binding MarR family transcriptional regulator